MNSSAAHFGCFFMLRVRINYEGLENNRTNAHDSFKKDVWHLRLQFEPIENFASPEILKSCDQTSKLFTIQLLPFANTLTVNFDFQSPARSLYQQASKGIANFL